MRPSKYKADNIDLYGDGTGTNSNSAWGTKCKNALNTYATNNGEALTSANLAAATQYAREIADAGRALPGTPKFNELPKARPEKINSQVSVKISKVKTSVKAGATNIFNKRYIQYAGGPTIGGLYYVPLH